MVDHSADSKAGWKASSSAVSRVVWSAGCSVGMKDYPMAALSAASLASKKVGSSAAQTAVSSVDRTGGSWAALTVMMWAGEKAVAMAPRKVVSWAELSASTTVGSSAGKSGIQLAASRVVCLVAQTAGW